MSPDPLKTVEKNITTVGKISQTFFWVEILSPLAQAAGEDICKRAQSVCTASSDAIEAAGEALSDTISNL